MHRKQNKENLGSLGHRYGATERRRRRSDVGILLLGID